MNTLKVILLLSMLSGLLMIVGYLLGKGKGMVIALILSAVMNFGSYWFSDSIVLKMYSAQPVTQAEAPDFMPLWNLSRPRPIYPCRSSIYFLPIRPTPLPPEEMKIMPRLL